MGHRQPNQLRGAGDVGAEKVFVVEDVINQRARVHDTVDLPGQPIEVGGGETDARFGDVADHDLEVICGQFTEAPLEGGIGAFEHRGQATPGRLPVCRPDQADKSPAARG